jgi:hypothetical protein
MKLVKKLMPINETKTWFHARSKLKKSKFWLSRELRVGSEKNVMDSFPNSAVNNGATFFSFVLLRQKSWESKTRYLFPPEIGSHSANQSTFLCGTS